MRSAFEDRLRNTLNGPSFNFKDARRVIFFSFFSAVSVSQAFATWSVLKYCRIWSFMFSCLVEGRGGNCVSTGGTDGISGIGVSLFVRILFRRSNEILRYLGVLGLSEEGRFCVVTQSPLADLFGSITLESFLLRLL